MKIIVGLGNIGEKYEKTRHNVGFMTIDLLAEKLDAKFKNKPKFQAMIAESDKALLVKPTTYMNRSGDALALVSKFYKTKPEDIIIIYDDIDLPIGTIRIRKEGSAGTHNGMKSVVAALGQNVPRIRIGTQASTPLKKDLADFVLSGFSVKERPIIKQVIEDVTNAALEMLDTGTEQVMQSFN